MKQRCIIESLYGFSKFLGNENVQPLPSNILNIRIIIIIIITKNEMLPDNGFSSTDVPIAVCGEWSMQRSQQYNIEKKDSL